MKRFSVFFVIVFVIFFCFDAVAEEVTCTHSNRKYIYLESYEEQLGQGSFYCYKSIQPIELVCFDCNSILEVECLSTNYEHDFSERVCKKCASNYIKVLLLNILFLIGRLIVDFLIILILEVVALYIIIIIFLIIKIIGVIKIKHKDK